MIDEIKEDIEEVLDAPEEVEEKAEEKTFDYAASQEEKARNSGWLPQEEYLAEGKNPASWTPAPEFNIRGEFIDKLKYQETKHNEEIGNLNTFHQVQLKAQLAELQEKKEEIILEGGDDVINKVKNVDHQINNLQVPVQPTKDPAVASWEADNPWINTPGAKSTYANSLFQQAKQGGYNSTQALAYVSQEIAKEYPAKPRNKETVPMGERGNGPKSFTAPKSGKLTMADVTPDELKLRSQGPASWSDDAKFLKDVENSRKL